MEGADGRDLACPSCGKEYTTDRGLRYHIDDCCPSELIGCPSCHKRYFTERGVEVHHSQTHGESLAQSEYNCDYCGKSFKRQDTNATGEHVFCDVSCKASYQSENHTGPNNPNYKNRIGNERLYYGRNWSNQRERCRNRDSYKCQCCGVDESELSKPLDVHHITPFKKFDNVEKANRLDNLISLCRSCHMKWEGLYLRPDTR